MPVNHGIVDWWKFMAWPFKTSPAVILHGIIFFNILQHEIWYFLEFCIYPGSNIVALITVTAKNVENKISANDEIDFSTILRLVSMYPNDHYYTLQLAGRFLAIVLIISI